MRFAVRLPHGPRRRSRGVQRHSRSQVGSFDEQPWGDPSRAFTITDIEELPILYDDADLELISEVTGEPTEWVVARGSID